ncbi:unnamed protein product [Moneuplotes crassus]|uniref:Glutathione S-transferase n=1 Tax=Euplotes crassus TaxID=5936 RepID=A0AAD2D3U4_EUPCR|nr:unnamed protein product [Moneuplotes crassus]
MSKITFYGNSTSQPSRTVAWTLKTLGVEYDYKYTASIKDTRSEEFTTKVNVFHQVPAIVVDDTTIVESNTIVRYLINEYDKDENLLPRDNYLERAKAEEILDIGTTNVRSSMMSAVNPIVVGPLFFGAEKPSEEEQKKLIEDLNKTFEKLNTKLGDKAYFAGDKLTVGDIQIYNEIQTALTLLQLDLADYPQLNTWYETVGANEILAEITKEMLEALAALNESK